MRENENDLIVNGAGRLDFSYGCCEFFLFLFLITEGAAAAAAAEKENVG